jgi:integrase
MTILNLNRDTIRTLPETEGVYRDTALKGFMFVRRRAASGTMFDRFVIQYRWSNVQRKITLDPAKFSFDQARKLAKETLAKVALKTDPRAEQDAAAAKASRLTFDDAVKQYLAMKGETLRPASLKIATLYLESPRYFPTLHGKALDDITRSEVAQHLDRINAESGNATAGRARAQLGSFIMWCLRRGHVRENVVVATEAPKIKNERKRALSADELRRVWLACDDSDYGRIVRLLILTGARREEIGGLRWSEIDLAKGTLTIAAERSKNHRPHTLPLSPMALDIIRSIPQSGEHVFGNGFRIWGYSKARLLERIGAMNEWRLHDLRHTVSTGLHELGTEPSIVEAILNHVSGHRAGVAGRYNHATYERQIKVALAMWADHVQSVVSGEASKIVALRRA